MKFVSNSKYTNFGPRFLASWIDGLLLNLPSWYVLMTLTTSTSLEQLIGGVIERIALVFLPMCVVGFFYSAYSLKLWGKTPGKAIVGMEVTDDQGKYLSLGRSFFREYIAKPINGALFGLGFLSILFDAHHQGWHDHLAGSFVHKRRSQILYGVAVLVGLLIVHVGIVYVGYRNLMVNQAFLDFISALTTSSPAF